jgi:hypothetical protein
VSLSKVRFGIEMTFLFCGETMMETPMPSKPPPDPDFEIELARGVFKLVGMVAASLGVSNNDACKISAALTHKLAHRIVNCTIAQLHTHRVMIRLEILAERMVNRELVRRAKCYKRTWLDDEDCRKVLKREPQQRTWATLGELLKPWLSLTGDERRVVKLQGLKLDDSSISYILGIPTPEVTEIRHRADEKFHQAYVSCR